MPGLLLLWRNNVYKQALDASSTTTPVIIINPNRVLAVANSWVAAMITLSSYFRSLAVATSWTIALVKKMFVTLSTAGTWTSVLARLPNKILAIANAWVVAITTRVLYMRTLAVSSTFTVALNRKMFKVFAVAATLTPTLVFARFYTKTLAVGATWTAALVARANKVLAIATSWTVTLTERLLLHVTLAVVTTWTVVLSYVVGLPLQVAYWVHRLTVAMGAMVTLAVEMVPALHSLTIALGLTNSATRSLSLSDTRSAPMPGLTSSLTIALQLTNSASLPISLINLATRSLAVPPLTSVNISGFAAGDKFNVSRIVTSIPTGRTLTKAWLTVKAIATDADPGLLQKSITTASVGGVGQITAIGDGTGGQAVGTGAFFFEMTAVDTRALGAILTYVYDIQMKFDNGDIATLEIGKLTFIQDVTTTTT